MGVPVFQRRKNQQNPCNRNPIRGYMFIQIPHFFSADAARMDIPAPFRALPGPSRARSDRLQAKKRNP